MLRPVLGTEMSKGPAHTPPIRLFQSEWLERLTKISLSSFLVVWLLGLPLSVLAGSNGDLPLIEAVGLIVAGFFFWLPVEYALHRFLFHWKSKQLLVQRFVFIMHGNHHVSPNDPLRSLMPPIVSVPVGLALRTLSVSLEPWGIWAFLGFGIGYVTYDLTHYACHQLPMNGRFGKALKRHHMRHHYVDDAANYAVTAPLLDGLIGSKVEGLKKS